MRHQLTVILSHRVFYSLIRAMLGLGTLLLPGELYAQSLYLDMEPPDGKMNGINYQEGGETYPAITPDSWGYGAMEAEGRHSWSSNSLKAVLPIDTRAGAVNRKEWAFYKWQVDNEYWTGFSVKFPSNFPTPLEGEQSTMFAQLQNVWPGKQVAWYIHNKPAASDPLEFWCQIQYGESTANTDRIRVNLFPGTILQKGEWIDVVSHYKINPNRSDSFFKTWINGQLVVDYSGKIGIEGASSTGSHKIGLYGGSQSQFREMLIDEVRYGNSYAEVDPAQGGSPPPPSATNQLEAEGVSTQSGFSPFEVGSDSNASEGQYIHAPGKESKSSPPSSSSGRANYSFTLDAPGDATLTARVLAPNTGANSFWFQIDGGAWQPWSINAPSSDWQEVMQTISGLSAGNHTLTTTYREGNTKLDWFSLESNQPAGGELEAEGASTQSGFSPFEVGNDGNASEGQFIHAPGRESKSNPPSSGIANYSFSLASAGDALLTARVRASSTSSNSFWYRIDSQTWAPWSVSNTSNNWQEVSRTIPGLSAGNHSLSIAYREGNTKLDRFEVTASSNGRTITSPAKQAPLVDLPTQEFKRSDKVIASIYPNPSHTSVTVSTILPEQSGYQVSLVDLSGRVVVSEELTGQIGSNDHSLELTTLPRGIYALRVETTAGVATKRLILQ